MDCEPASAKGLSSLTCDTCIGDSYPIYHALQSVLLVPEATGEATYE
jgi:hypothetical protein